MKKSQTYPTHVYWDERDNGFVALAPDLPGCSAFGDTKAKALKELEHAIDAWIETATLAHEPVPEPSPLPKPTSYSGKTLVRMPSSLHERLAKDAAVEGVSLNHHIVVILAKAVGSGGHAATELKKLAPTNYPSVVTDKHFPIGSWNRGVLFYGSQCLVMSGDTLEEPEVMDNLLQHRRSRSVFVAGCHRIDNAKTKQDYIIDDRSLIWQQTKDHQNG